MAVRLQTLCWDAADPAALARFWARLLGWEAEGVLLRPDDDTGFAIRFEPTAAPKTWRNQMHLDLTSSSPQHQQETVAQALSLGGAHLDSGSCPRRGTSSWPIPRATSCASSSRATGSWPSADSSERCPATDRARWGCSGARPCAGRWSGTRTRRPRSARRTVARRSPGADRRWPIGRAATGCASSCPSSARSRSEARTTARARCCSCCPLRRPTARPSAGIGTVTTSSRDAAPSWSNPLGAPTRTSLDRPLTVVVMGSTVAVDIALRVAARVRTSTGRVLSRCAVQVVRRALASQDPRVVIGGRSAHLPLQR
jgi:hypothetical protein